MRFLVGVHGATLEVEAACAVVMDGGGLELHDNNYQRLALFKEYTFYIQLPEPVISGTPPAPAVEAPF